MDYFYDSMYILMLWSSNVNHKSLLFTENVNHMKEKKNMCLWMQMDLNC